MKILKYVLVPIVLLSLPACRSMYYYRVKAANKAREYALEKMTYLSQKQRDYIRYAPPYFLQSTMFAREGKKFESKKDVVQTCVVWDVPGMEKSTVVVGTAERRLDDWYPIKVVFKNFENADKEKATAMQKARKYVVQKMMYLSTAEQNRVRFTYPLVAFTSFDVEPRRKLGSHFQQISMIWNSKDEKEKIVVTGFGRKDLHDWLPVTGIVRPTTEVETKKEPEFISPY